MSGCAAGTKVRRLVDPVVLTIGTDDKPGVPAADQIEEFARQVSKLSDGAITIEPEWHAAGDTADWDQRVAELVVDGDLDLGLVPARAWSALGAMSLAVLNTPFLIQSDELVRAVLSDDVAVDLMAGLEDAGAVGVGMFPEGLRHPFGFAGALGGPSSYEGGLMRAATSGESSAMYAALGAKDH